MLRHLKLNAGVAEVDHVAVEVAEADEAAVRAALQERFDGVGVVPVRQRSL